MSKIERKIEDGMSLEEILTVMSEGDDGARSVLTKVMNFNIFNIMRLDKLQIRGEKINILYKECCQNRDDKFYLTLEMLRLNTFSQEQIQRNLESDMPISFIDDNIKIEGMSYFDFNSVNKRWREWCEEQKVSFIKRSSKQTK